MKFLDALERLVPVIAKAELACRLLELPLAPGELLVGNFDQLLWGVGDHFVLQGIEKRAAANGIAEDRVIFPFGKSRQLRPQEGRVTLEGPVDLLVGLPGPPRDLRVVSRIKIIPFLEHGAQLIDLARRPARKDTARQALARAFFRLELFFERFLESADVFAQQGQRFGGSLGIDRLHAAPCLLELEYWPGEGQEVRDFGELCLRMLEHAQLGGELVLKKQVVDPLVLVEGLEAHDPQLFRFVLEKAAKTVRFALGNGEILVTPLKSSQVGGVLFDDSSQEAYRGILPCWRARNLAWRVSNDVES